MLRISLTSSLLLALTGCALEPLTPVAEPEGPPAVASRVVETQLTITPDAPEPPPAPAQPIAPPRDPVPFRIGAGYGALARVDFASCSERGLPPGYMRIRATFSRVGIVARASVETPRSPRRQRSTASPTACARPACPRSTARKCGCRRPTSSPPPPRDRSRPRPPPCPLRRRRPTRLLPRNRDAADGPLVTDVGRGARGLRVWRSPR